MSIALRGSKWQAYVTHAGKRYRATFDNKSTAEVWEVQARQALKLGKPVPSITMGSGASMTLAKAFDRTYKTFWKGGKSDEKMQQYIRNISDMLGANRSVSEITTEVVDEFIETLKDMGKSNGTVNRYLACLSKTLRHAQDRGVIDKMPKIHRQREGQGRIRWLTKEEEQACIQTMEQWGYYDLKDAFIVSIDTGIRLSELNRLTDQDILKEGVFIEERKNSTHSVIPLTTRARAILEARAASRKGQLFPARKTWMRSSWERVKLHLELDDVVWHTLRHTTCSRLVQRGMPLMHVKEWMGHKAIQTTMRYSHLSTAHLSSGVSLLEQ